MGDPFKVPATAKNTAEEKPNDGKEKPNDEKPASGGCASNQVGGTLGIVAVLGCTFALAVVMRKRQR